MALVESPRARRDQYLNNGLEASSRRNARSRSRSPQVSAGTARALAAVPRTSSKDSISAEQARAKSPAPAAPSEPVDGPSEQSKLPPVRTRHESSNQAPTSTQQQQPQPQPQPPSPDGEDAEQGSASGSGQKRAHSESPAHRRQQQRVEVGEDAPGAETATASTAGARPSPFLSSAFASASLQMQSPPHGSPQQSPSGSQGTDRAAGGLALPPLKMPREQLLHQQLLTEADIQQAVSLKGWLPDFVGSPSIFGSPVDRQASLQHWARPDGSLSSAGSFSLQHQPHGPLRSNSSMRLGRNDSLELDIRVMAPVLPEQYPEGALEEHEQTLLQQQRRRQEQQEEDELIERQEAEAEAQEAAEQAAAMAAEAHHQQQEQQRQDEHAQGSPHSTPPHLAGRPGVPAQGGRSRLAVSSGGSAAEADASASAGAGPSGASEQAFFAKIASWEQELVGMLQAQETPVSIRAIIATFKDRILTERDKTEFKGLCDKWTSVVEWPAGTKCLQMKSWMRGANFSA